MSTYRKSKGNRILKEYRKIALYMRYSTHNQDDGYSIEYQRTEINEFAEKNHLDVDVEFIDEAKTGTKVAGRDGFYNLIRAVKDGHIEAIIVYKLSRLFRDVKESQYYRDLFRKFNVKLISVTQKIDEETSSGRLSTNIISVIDQYQSEITSDHVKSSMREMARQGYHTGGLPLYGYDLQSFPHGKKVRKKLTPNDEEAQIVNKLFEMYANGHEVGYIRNYLHDELGARTKRGKFFSVQSLHRMLRNDSYIGVKRFETEGYDEVVVEDSHPAIISMTVWNAVQERIANRRKVKPRVRLERRIYPLTGKVFCSCGFHCIGYSGTNKKPKTGKRYTYFYYRCSYKHGYAKCDVTSIRREKLHEIVLNEIKKEFLTKEKIDFYAKEIVEMSNAPSESVQEQLKRLNKEKAEIEKSLNVLIDMRLKGEMSGETIRKRSAPLEEQLPKIEKQIFNLKESQNQHYSFDEIQKYLLEQLEKTKINDDEVLRSIFESFVESVVVSNTEIEVNLKMSTPQKLLFNITSGTPVVTLNNTLHRH